MDRIRTVGVAVSVLGLAGYVAGIWVPYPGRAVSVAAFMLGATVFAVGGEHD